MNRSYQREGFGILQDIYFDTYFGFWKNNKAEGRGIVFYRDCSVLFACFSRNMVMGPVIFDHLAFIRICFMEGRDKMGVAY